MAWSCARRQSRAESWDWRSNSPITALRERSNKPGHAKTALPAVLSDVQVADCHKCRSSERSRSSARKWRAGELDLERRRKESDSQMSSHSPPFISFETRINDGKLDAFRVPACSCY